jgi:hypothetical protein
MLGRKKRRDLAARRYLLHELGAAALAVLIVLVSGISLSGQNGGPFIPGERLQYRLSWLNFSSAATITFSTREQRSLYGWNVYHFRVVANSLPPLRKLFVIDDQIDSYTDSATFSSHQYETYLNELGHSGTSRMELTPQGGVPRGRVASVIVPPGTRDPVGLLESLRVRDWQANRELRVAIFDGTDVYEVRAARAAVNQQISVQAGSYDADQISIQCSQPGKDLQKIHFDVWISRDVRHMPVRMEAQLPIGTFRVELTGHSQETQPEK